MKFCHNLVSELNFEPHCISPCCNTRALKIPKFSYEGGQVDLDAYARHIENVARDMQREHGVCAGCPQLEECGELKNIGGGFDAISINMHRHFCNCKCVYCDLWSQPDKSRGYDILPALQSLKAQDAIARDAYISWGGGEPTILPCFENAARWALENGIEQYVHSNALKFSPLLAAMMSRGAAALNVSLDSGSAPVYKSVKGVDGFAAVVANLRIYASKMSQAIVLKYIVFEKNNDPAEIHRFLRLAKSLNVGAVNYSLNFLETNARTVSGKTLAGAAMFKVMADEIGLKCVDAFVDEPYLGKIEALAAKMAGEKLEDAACENEVC